MVTFCSTTVEAIWNGCAKKKPAIAIYEPELPLNPGVLPLAEGLTMPGCIRDAAPDAWGRRVITNKKLGLKGAGTDTAELDELIYLLESDSDRIGALDFQRSPTEYVPRFANNVSMEELIESAERVEKGVPLTTELGQALFHGSSIGGARPKALIQNEGKKYIAKFSSSANLYSVVKAEFIAMRLAALAGLNVAPVKLIKAANKDVLLIERFDREQKVQGLSRKAMVSALTLLGLDDMMARYASYVTVILSSVGENELFGGYRRYQGESYHQYYHMIQRLVQEKGNLTIGMFTTE